MVGQHVHRRASTLRSGDERLRRGTHAAGAAAGLPLYARGFAADSDPATLQTKLAVNTPGDPFEEEADDVAQRASRASDTTRSDGGSDGEVEEEPEEEDLQEGESTDTLRRKANVTTGEPLAIPTSSGQNTLSTGSALSSQVRHRVEPMLGIDLGHVRVHDDPGAHAAAAALHAKAFTHRNHIWVSAGQSNDMSLMAHEATHVAQQQRRHERLPALQRQETLSTPQSPEIEQPESDLDMASPRPASDAPAPEDYDRRTSMQAIAGMDEGLPSAVDVDEEIARADVPETAAALSSDESGDIAPSRESEQNGGNFAWAEGGDGAESTEEGGGAGHGLIDEELVEHERWAGSFGSLGTAGSDQRAQFLLNQVGQGAASGAQSGAVMGFAMSAVGAGIGQIAGRRLATLAVSRGATVTPVPGLGSAIGGVMAVAGLAMRDWGATFDTIGKFGQGEGYESLANDLEAIAEALDMACSIIDVLAGVFGLISVGMWAFAIVTAGVLSPLAAILSSLAIGMNLATTAIGIVINVVVRPTVVALRALHTFQSKGDPTQIEAEGQILQAAAGQITGAVAGAAAGKAGGAVGARVGTRLDRGFTQLQSRRTGGRPLMSATVGDSPSLHVDAPDVPPRPDLEGTGPVRGPVSEGGPSMPRPAAVDGPAAATPGTSGSTHGPAAASTDTSVAPSEATRRSQRTAPSPESFADAEFDAILHDLRNSELGHDLEASRRRSPAQLREDTVRTRAQVDSRAHRAARRNPPPGQVPGAQIQHNTKTLDVTRNLPPGMAPLHPDVINENINWLQSRQDLPATELHVDPAGGGTRYYIDDIPRGRVGDQGMRGEQFDLFTPSRGPRDPDYNTEHKFTDNYLIPTESRRIAEARRQAGLPPLDPRMLAIAAGEQARYILTGHSGTERSGRMINVAQQASSRPDTPRPHVASPQTEFDFGAATQPAVAPAASSPALGPRSGGARSSYPTHSETNRTTDRAAAMSQYHEQVRADPGRESGVWRGADGTYYVMQGDSGSVRPPAAAGPLELIYHSHPTESSAAMQGLVSQPSQAGGDLSVLQDQHGQGPAGRRQSSELHFPVYDDAGTQVGYGATRFAYDPTHPLPIQVETRLPDGRISRQRYASFENFESRTGVGPSGKTPELASANRAAAIAQLTVDVAAAGGRIDETARTLTGPTRILGVREGRERGRRELAEEHQANGASLAGPAYTAGVAGLQPGESVEIPINPTYPTPPGTTAELEGLMAQVHASQAAQGELADTENAMQSQAEQQRTHASQLGEAGQVAEDLASGRGDHEGAVEQTASTNTEQQSTAGSAIDSLGRSAQESTALVTLVGSLRVFQGLSHLFSYLPGELGEKAKNAKRDAAGLITTLNRVSETEDTQASIESGRDVIAADAQRIDTVGTCGEETDQALQSGQEQLSALSEANAQSLAETESVREQADAERAAAAENEAEAQSAHDNLLAELQTWADTHRQAREDAISQATTRFVEMGYAVRQQT